MTTIETMGQQAKTAQRLLAKASGQIRAEALCAVAAALKEKQAEILAENALDLQAGEQGGLSKSLLDRLALSGKRIADMAQGVRDVAAREDPVGRVLSGGVRPNGLKIYKLSVPLGVIGIIYEARPNVTSDAAALCLKAGNAVILRGGKEAFRSNRAVVSVMRAALESAGLPADCVQLVEDTSRESATALMLLNGYIDVLIPRGGAGLIRSVVENATVPVIETGAGNCHIYVDDGADIPMAAEIVCFAKTSRPSVCNACESLLVHRDIAALALPAIQDRLGGEVELRGDETVCALLPDVLPASEEDWYAEYNDYILSVHIVEDLDEAIAWIDKYSTHHSDCIVTEDYRAAQQFLDEVDSAAVYVNASTRFTDGGEFGFGAEIGISTQKLHARGPLGLDKLVSEKFVIYGNGQLR